MSDHNNAGLESFLGMVHTLGNRLHNTTARLQQIRISLEGNRSKKIKQLEDLIDSLDVELRAILRAGSEILRNAQLPFSESRRRGPVGSGPSEPIRVLWVDDDALHMSALRGQFEDAKWQLTIAPTVTDGLRLISEYSFDGVMLDQLMPPEDLGVEETGGGLRTGLALARRIRTQQPSMPIVFFTIANASELVDWCRETPPAIVLAKPLRGAEVVRQAETLIRYHTDPSVHEVEDILRRFPLFVRALSHRHADRPRIQLLDAYDVQDLLRGLLAFDMEEVREEEWTPSYVGASSRIDFVLPTRKTAIEVKMTRPGMTLRKLGDELLIDIARYRTHPDVRSLVCFIVDAGGIITNREGLIRDFRMNSSAKLEVRTVICDIISEASKQRPSKVLRKR